MLDAKFLLTVVAGAIAGAAVTWLFGTQEGRDFLTSATELEKQLRKDFDRLMEEES